MAVAEDLRRELARIDGRGYPAYKGIVGSYGFPGFELRVDHVQGDPFAEPSRLRVVISPERMGLPEWSHTPATRRRATTDWLTRRFADAVGQVCVGPRRGSGKSGLVAVDRLGQEVLERTACVVAGGRVEVRFTAGLPAGGRRVRGRDASEMLLEEVPAVVERALLLDDVGREGLRRHVEVVEDQVALRDALAERGLIAFMGDGAVLPRESGVSDRPLRIGGVVPFGAPEGLAVEIETPHRGRVRGLGVPPGVTLVVGGGYHGKSTLLRALAHSVYDHIPGDGRELVVTDAAAVKIRAEDGRRVERVDISPFITDLPNGEDTRFFCTGAASGSTSQAANIIEALELGARVLLIDEDTSATNFMIRDRRMQALVHREGEPIRPFIDRARPLFRDMDVSTVLVIGGSGDYLDVADTVIRMDHYEPYDVTEAARRVAREIPTGRLSEADTSFPPPPARVPVPKSVDPRRGDRVKVRARGTNEIGFGQEEIELNAVEQIVSPSQTRAIGAFLRHARGRWLDGRLSLREALEAAANELSERGLDVLSPFDTPVGDLALPRTFEVGAALNRLRSLRVLEK